MHIRLSQLLETIRHPDLHPTSKTDEAIEDLEILVSGILKRNKELEELIELGQSEMNGVWELIHARESLINAILGASQDIILTINHDKNVIEFNHSAEEFFGYSKKQIQGKSIFSLFNGGTLLTDLETYFSETTSSENSYFGTLHERTIICNNGREFPISIFPSRIESGNKIFYTLYMQDLTQKKENEKLIEDSRAQMMLASKFSALGEMAGGIAHEINTPLAVIQMRAEQMLEALDEGLVDPPLFLNAATAVDKTVRRIAKIVQGLRSFARDGRQDPPVPTSLNQIIDDTFSLCREKFYNHGVQITFDSSADLLINCRSNEISQVLLNLFNNSFDAIAKNQQKWVRIHTETHDDMVKIVVTDSGTGIPQSIQNKIMQPFFTTKDIGKGTGLGLSISRGIIEAHNGTLFIDNERPNTTFCITLPISFEDNKTG